VKRFLFGRYVEGDLREIKDHISKDSPESARRMMVRFVEAFRLLASRPGLGPAREDLPFPSLRFWPVGSFLILYLAKQPLEIVAVLHGARDIPALINRRL
jgi:plasmid stabilization system protein ParE